MSIVVAGVGLFIFGVGLTVLVSPRILRVTLRTLVDRRWFPLLSLVRIVVGVVFVLAAPSTRLPIFVWAMGLLFIVAGVSLPLLGFRRLGMWVERWARRPDRMIRAWSLLALLLGVLLMRAGA